MQLRYTRGRVLSIQSTQNSPGRVIAWPPLPSGFETEPMCHVVKINDSVRDILVDFGFAVLRNYHHEVVKS